jgi:hypothetical protein
LLSHSIEMLSFDWLHHSDCRQERALLRPLQTFLASRHLVHTSSGWRIGSVAILVEKAKGVII